MVIESSTSEEEESNIASSSSKDCDECSAGAGEAEGESIPSGPSAVVEVENSKERDKLKDADCAQDEEEGVQGRMQAAVTQKLLDSLWKYLGVELTFSNVKEEILSCVISKKKKESRKEDEVLHLVKDHMHAYARALLLYRRDHCLAYTDGSDKTSTEPLCVFPPRNGLFLHLKEAYNLPTVLPHKLKVKKRNNLFLAFRCFAPMSNTASVYYPTLRSNEELMKLPGFAEKFRHVLNEEDGKFDGMEGSFLWKCIQKAPAEQRFELQDFPALHLKSFDGIIAREEYKMFWEEFIRAAVTTRIEEEVSHGLSMLNNLDTLDCGPKWLCFRGNSCTSPSGFPALGFSCTATEEAVYANASSPYFVHVDSICLVRVVLFQGKSRVREYTTLAILEKLARTEFGIEWYFIFGQGASTSQYGIEIQCYPMLRMTVEKRRERAVMHLENIEDSILRPLLRPQQGYKVKEPDLVEKDPENKLVDAVRDHYARALNGAQRKVIDTSLKALDADQSYDGNGVILVQGPPGTGKSTTIVSLIAVLLAKGRERRFRGKKILVCAPSNAAVDVLARRVLNGVKAARFQKKSQQVQLKELVPKAVRLGHGCKDEVVKKITLDDVLGRSFGSGESRRTFKEAKLLEDADIWFSTCASIGYQGYAASAPSFMAVIIDEASQAVELDCLLPLLPFPSSARGTGAKMCVLVGDTKQLPPFEEVRMSSQLIKKGMMGRLVEYYEHFSNNCIRLKTQYRMHPAISEFPAQEFYSGYLENDQSVYDPSKFDRPYHFDARGRFGALTFIDTSQLTDHAEAYGAGKSMYNMCELRIVEDLVVSLVRLHRPAVRKSVVVLSPYSRQLEFLTSRSSSIPEFKEVSVASSTVDSMQGDERDIVILTTVRSSEERRLGFLVDYRRLNVGLTRARYSLIIVGDSETLEADSIWRNLIERCKKSTSPNIHFLFAKSHTSTREFCRRLFPESQSREKVLWEERRCKRIVQN